MPNGTPLAVIMLTIERAGGLITITSKDVPGLHISSYDVKSACSNVIPAIKILFKKNRGLDVEVVPAADPITFPASGEVCFNEHLAERYVMYPSQAAA